MNADSQRPAKAAGRPGPAGPACVLGLDLGTSSAKAVVTDTGGKVLAQAAAGYAVAASRVNRFAAISVLPYVGWIGFATYLNAAILRRNPNASRSV